MITLRVFSSPVLAESAARFLRASGIDARVSSRLGPAGIFGALGHGEYVVNLLDASQRERAEDLLLTFVAHPPEIDPADLDPLPDFSRLDPRYRPTCPRCAVVLTPSLALRNCPGCLTPVDPEELIVQQHGPEAMAACYPDEPEALPRELLASVALSCPECRYSLESLSDSGVCPECGTPYSKAELVSRRAGPL
jgi:hypothetical protein